MSVVVCTLYKFVTLDNFEKIQASFLKKMHHYKIRGTLLLAKEGINGTVAGSRKSIDHLIQWLKSDSRLASFEYKESYTNCFPFKRTKVKLKKEIVTIGVEGIDPNRFVGTYVLPEDWNNLVNDPNMLIIDTRNDYEIQVGTFQNAINPKIRTFRNFPQYVKKNLNIKKHKKIAMFCTGGIRCEKATAYMKEQGFKEVFHLKGGILKYFEKIPTNKSIWKGECFVFDDRVTVNHDLKKGNYDQCYACRLPITKNDKDSKNFIKGVSCPHCFDKHTPDRLLRFKEREHQMQLTSNRIKYYLDKDCNIQ